MNLKQLADHLKLSPTTVSRALNNYPEVSESTRKKVVAAAQENNYHPSSHASRLAKGIAHTIAHVIPLSEHSVIDPHFSDFIAGAGNTYAASGYDMLLRVVDKKDEESLYRSYYKDGRVDGVVLHGARINDSRVSVLRDLGLPFVVHGRTLQDESSYCWLDVNNFRAFERATKFLIDLGHQQIALVNGMENQVFASRRRDGYIKALNTAGIPVNPNFLFSGEMIEPQGYLAVKHLLKQNKPPTAILLSSILPAMGAVRAINEAGLSVSKDISLLVYDDQLSFLQNSGEIPMFTCVRSSIKEAGSRVAEMLLDIISSPESEKVHELWEAELVVGTSTSRLVEK